MPDALDRFMEQQYTGQFYQPAMPPGTVNTGKVPQEEEPPLLEGKKKLNLFPYG